MRSRMTQALFLLTLAALAHDVSAQTQGAIHVNGQAEIAIPNTEARISAGVTTTDLSADAALAANNTQMNAIYSALAGAGIDDDDIATSQFSFHPVYRYDDGTAVFDGYRVRNTIRVTIEEVELLGAILDLVINAGATEIHSVGFGASDFDTVKAQAITAATADAAAKAQLLAEATGVSLGSPISVNLSSNLGAITEPSFDAVSFSAGPPTSPGQHRVLATVSITYAIDDGQ